MEQNKEQKSTGNDLWKYEELQQKSLTLLKIIAYFTDIVVFIEVTIRARYG